MSQKDPRPTSQIGRGVVVALFVVCVLYTVGNLQFDVRRDNLVGDELWGPEATAEAIAVAIVEQETPFDLLMFGNESADAADYQVGIRVAHALDMPCVTGVKSLEIADGKAIARREGSDGIEVFELELPAVVTVKEGINVPRYPSIPGRLKAKKKEITRVAVERPEETIDSVKLILPPGRASQVEVLGTGKDAAAAVVDMLLDLKLVAP